MTERELKRLPSFLSEDGGRRYIREVDGDIYVLDEYGRELRRDNIVGDVWFAAYDDERQTVMCIDIWAENYSFHKHTYKMAPCERIENCIMRLRGEMSGEDKDPSFYKRTLLTDETAQIQAAVAEVRKKYPGEYLEPEDYFSEIGLHL